MQLLSQMAYSTAAGHTASDRQVEKRLFEQVTAALLRADSATDTPVHERVGAVYQNAQLWSALAGDLLHPQNALPAELKASLLGLAQFVQAETQRILQKKTGLTDIIAINQSILGGLSGRAVSSGGEGA